MDEPCRPCNKDSDKERLLVSEASAILIRLVDCLGFNGPLRQYFSLYHAVSQTEGVVG